MCGGDRARHSVACTGNRNVAGTITGTTYELPPIVRNALKSGDTCLGSLVIGISARASTGLPLSSSLNEIGMPVSPRVKYSTPSSSSSQCGIPSASANRWCRIAVEITVSSQGGKGRCWALDWQVEEGPAPAKECNLCLSSQTTDAGNITVTQREGACNQTLHASQRNARRTRSDVAYVSTGVVNLR